MTRFTRYILATLLLLCASARAGNIVNIDLVPVGDAGNVADPTTGYGAVPYSYSMGKYDVTTGQYTAFLNAVATTGDPYGLYNPAMASDFPTFGITKTTTSGVTAYAVKGNSLAPVFDVSWGDAARFVNWLQNNQPAAPEGPATTEFGTYALNGGTTDTALMAASRNSTATWVLPNVNEWYKSAYYAGGGINSSYWNYPTQSNSVPSNTLSLTGTNNANFYDNASGTVTDPINFLTPVGAFINTSGEYGTFDQAGDVLQWLETPVGTSYREDRGGSFSDVSANFYSSTDGYSHPTNAQGSSGFRVEEVPEPETSTIICGFAVAYSFFQRRRRSIKRIEL